MDTPTKHTYHLLAVVIVTAICGPIVYFRQPPAAKPIDPTPEPAAPLSAQIFHPDPGAHIDDAVFQGLKGSYRSLPPSHTLWVFLHDGIHYYLQYPNAIADSRTNTFSHRNIRMASPGRWTIFVCAASDDAAKELHAYAQHNKWSLPSLPSGVTTLQSVDVHRR